MESVSSEKTCGARPRGPGRRCRALLLRRAALSVKRLRMPGWQSAEGAELVELALVLPILLVMVCGIMDFGTAFNLRQKLAAAAREGARLGTSQPHGDLTKSSPPSVLAIKNSVTDSLQQAGVNTAFIGSTMNYNSTAPCTATFYTSSGGVNYGLKIERCVSATSGGTNFLETQVTLTYPYDWTYGFNRVVKLLVPASALASKIGINVAVTMVNLS